MLIQEYFMENIYKHLFCGEDEPIEPLVLK